MHIEENRPLAPFTTFAIGGPARWFISAETEADIAESVDWAHKQGTDLFILGGGSNLLVSDSGFDGLVLHIALTGISKTEDPTHITYQCAAGESWDPFVERAARDNNAGIECLAGIPGTVGGTPVQNVGAYGQEVSSTILRVRAFDREDRAFVELPAADCAFAYRRSRFNSTDYGRFIVTRVDYRLARNAPPTLRYADLQREFPSAGPAPTFQEVTAQVRRIRHSKSMLLVEGDPDSRSAGSFFKNPIVSVEQADRIAASTGKELPRFPAGEGPENSNKVKLPAAWLIEQAGFTKGYSRGPAAISSRHTLALVNRGNATAMDILDLASEIHVTVEKKFAIHLEPEPAFVGRLA